MAENKNVNLDAENEEEMTVTLTLDDGRELECVVLTIFPAGDKEYIALLPMDDEDSEEGEVYLYRYTAVSYTHLAVYKRQVQCWQSCFWGFLLQDF